MKDLLNTTSSSEKNSRGWRARNGLHGNVVIGKSKVDSLLKKWHPFSNLYIAPSDEDEFNLAIDIEEARDQIYLSYVRRNKLSIVMLAAATIFIACVGWLHKDIDKLRLALALACLVTFMALDYVTSASNVNKLSERSKFYLHIYRSGRLDFVLWSGFMIVIALLQLLYQSYFGDFEKTLAKFGVFYEALDHGEWWRLLTGTFLHVNFLHWFVNLASLLLIVGLGGSISRRFMVMTFLISSFLGAYSGWMLSVYTDQAAYAGVSGGIYGILGMCASFCLCRPCEFPHRMGMMVAAFGVLNIIISTVLVSNSSIEGHITGLAVGLFLGTVFSLVTKVKTPPAQSSPAPCPTRAAHAPAADSPH